MSYRPLQSAKEYLQTINPKFHPTNDMLGGFITGPGVYQAEIVSTKVEGGKLKLEFTTRAGSWTEVLPYYRYHSTSLTPRMYYLLLATGLTPSRYEHHDKVGVNFFNHLVGRKLTLHINKGRESLKLIKFS